MRVIAPAEFAMTCGVIVPVHPMLLDAVFDQVVRRIPGEPDAIANGRRFATALYRPAVMAGVMEHVGSADPG